MDRAPTFVTPGALAALLYGLIKDRPADLLFVGAVVLLAAFGVISPEEAFSGFANSGMLVVAAMFVVAGGLRETGLMDEVGERLLGRVETEGRAPLVPAIALIPSALVLNNTPTAGAGRRPPPHAAIRGFDGPPPGRGPRLPDHRK